LSNEEILEEWLQCLLGIQQAPSLYSFQICNFQATELESWLLGAILSALLLHNDVLPGYGN
jgi:hypothetical protein